LKKSIFFKGLNRTGLFSIIGDKFTSTEQYFMSRKAKQWPSTKNDIIFKAILNSKTPKKAKTLGRSVENFNELEWANVRFEIMKAGLRYKFENIQI